ncbi:MAG: hypothetical protein KDA84_26720 [Planctomycetaceae bacterium]|nr:hypothetical protein [Planctomycetaceae bacterium]
MIKCKNSDHPYTVFTEFIMEFLTHLANEEIDEAEAMIDEQGFCDFRERIELGQEMETEFLNPIEEKNFALHFYTPARDLGHDHTVEFYIPNTEMELDTAFEFEKVKGGYRTHLVRL